MSYFLENFKQVQYLDLLQCLKEDFKGKAPSTNKLIKKVIFNSPWKQKTLVERVKDLEDRGFIRIENKAYSAQVDLVLEGSIDIDLIQNLFPRK